MNRQIYQEACDWFVEFRAGEVGAGARKRFDTWIRKSPEHLRAYLEITEIWQDAADVKPGDQDDVAAALATGNDNVLPLQAARIETPDPAQSTALPARRSRAATAVRPRVLALAASLLLAVTAWLTWHGLQGSTYSTGIGEQRIVSLSDGSTIHLNATSKIRVRFSDRERAVDIRYGQALFTVARDHTRPFVVSSGTAKLRALGTQFDVYRKRSGTVVTVLEGRVAVIDASANPGPPPDPIAASINPADAPLVLTPGDRLTISPNLPLNPQKTDTTSATAWTQQKLVFKSSPLSEVIDEFNRYNSRQLSLEGAGLADLRISGVYSSTNPALLLRFLREQPGITIHETDDQIVISSGP